MKAILRTNDYRKNYNIVKIIRDKVSETNHLSVVEIDGKEFMTGGILVEFNPITISVLDNLKPEEQYEWLKSIKKKI